MRDNVCHFRRTDTPCRFSTFFYKWRWLSWLSLCFSVYPAPLEMGSTLKRKDCFSRAIFSFKRRLRFIWETRLCPWKCILSTRWTNKHIFTNVCTRGSKLSLYKPLWTSYTDEGSLIRRRYVTSRHYVYTPLIAGCYVRLTSNNNG